MCVDSSAVLKSYVSSVLRLQEKYGWMLDSYVLDFFTKDLWQALPSKWTEVLGRLHPKEIAFFLLEVYGPEQERMLSPPTFRKVWPLELLAFLAACHSLYLQNQSMIRSYVPIKKQFPVSEGLFSKSVKEASDVTYEETSWENSHHERRKEHTSNQTSTGPNQQTTRCAQNLSLNHVFRCHVKPKKQHEIDVLSKVICEEAEKLRCWNIVDVGAGLGHLSRLLSYGCRLRVVTVEGDDCHETGVKELDRKLVKQLDKQSQKRRQVNGSDESRTSSLIHVTYRINTDISVEEFSNVVSEAFGKMNRFQDDNNCTTNTHPKNPHHEDSPEHFIIVGLHTCGDLAPTLLRLFCQCPNAVGIVSVGCCYMKLSREESNCEQASNKLDTHQCMNRRKDIKPPGYPLSSYLHSCPTHRQGYNGLEAACNAIGRYHKKLIEMSPTLKLHHYRALLELLLQRKNPASSRKQIRTLRTHKAAKMTFEEYVESACKILGLQEADCPTSQDIHDAEKLYQGKEYDVVVFYVLRLLLAPLVEGLILVDRLLFVKESCPDVNSRISVLFDADRSPRNMAIIGEKC